MIVKLFHNELEYIIDTSKAVDISIPYIFNGNQPNLYNVKEGSSKPLKSNNIDWSVSLGASCNVPEISMNIHCTGTHTETVGHLLRDNGNIGKIFTELFLPTVLITVDPEIAKKTNDKYHCDINEDELIITLKIVKLQLEKYINFNPIALIIRTLPNDTKKRFQNYAKEPPPFLSNNAMSYINKLNISHLIVDIPSIDRMNDDGILGNHRIFWGDGLNPRSEVSEKTDKTITEMSYIPNFVKDGIYFLNIQIPNFVLDAAPSRLFLYKNIS